MKLYIGTYAERGSQGIYTAECRDGKLSDVQVFAGIRDPKYLCTGEGIFAVGRGDEGCGVFAYASDGTLSAKVIFEHEPSCYICREGDHLYTANYHAGTVSDIVCEDGSLSLRKQVLIGDGAGCHQVIPYGEHLLVPSLVQDRVVILDRDLRMCDEIVLPKGSGPRHGVIIGDILYIATELSGELYAVSLKEHRILHSVVLGGAPAAVRLYEDHLYISVRETNRIFCVRAEDLQVTGSVSAEGDHPRDIFIQDGYLFTANRYSDELHVQRIGEDHLPQEILSRVHIPGCVSILTR